MLSLPLNLTLITSECFSLSCKQILLVIVVVVFFFKGFISILSVLSTYNLTQETRNDCEFVLL